MEDGNAESPRERYNVAEERAEEWDGGDNDGEVGLYTRPL